MPGASIRNSRCGSLEIPVEESGQAELVLPYQEAEVWPRLVAVVDYSSFLKSVPLCPVK